MAKIPAVILQHFVGLSEYERSLAIDKASRELGMSVDEIEAEIEAFEGGGFNQHIPAAESPMAEAPKRKSIFSRPKKEKEGGPEFLDESHRFRFRYDPSEAGMDKQKGAKQAITCPHCKAALAIPEIRPINVKCPACMMESTFEA
tara:strand:- start:267 stop:701 length:435 start_codon:yes stop_codon:yes gene_type:complete